MFQVSLIFSVLILSAIIFAAADDVNSTGGTRSTANLRKSAAKSSPAASKVSADESDGFTRLSYTGSVQTILIPAGVTSLKVKAYGASGGYYVGANFPSMDQTGGGLGGCMSATVPVTPGSTLYVYVGGRGDITGNGNGGWNGGGNGNSDGGEGYGGGGGGATDIRTSEGDLSSRLVVAGGGGGWGFCGAAAQIQTGGSGGLLIGGNGQGAAGHCASGTGGYGGTQSAGGSGEGFGDGGFGVGATGSIGGGGGYYGGGSGSGTGGGGGSSYAVPEATEVSTSDLCNTGDGWLKYQFGSGSNMAVDVSTVVSTKSADCFKNKGVIEVIPRAFKSHGVVDPNVCTSLGNLAAAGFDDSDVYMFPCPKCKKSASMQMEALVNNLRKNCRSSWSGRVWLDIENSDLWETQDANKMWYQALVAACSAKHVKCGVYSSASQWKAIFGSKTWNIKGGSNLPLWYSHYDGKASFSDFVPFGGWSSPWAKQYSDTTKLCGMGVDLDYVSNP